MRFGLAAKAFAVVFVVQMVAPVAASARRPPLLPLQRWMRSCRTTAIHGS